MRILLCIPTLAGGGAEGQLTLLSAGLEKLGWDVHVALFAGGPWERSMPPSVTLHRITIRGNHDPRSFTGTAGVMRRIKPSIVNTWLTQMDIVGGASARMLGLPWVATERSCADAYPPSVKTTVRRLLVTRANAIVANSDGGVDYWRPHRGTRALDRMIPNAVAIDASPEARLPDGLELPPDVPVVVYVGRLNEGKNVGGLLDAVALALKERDFVLLICGDGPLREQLEQHAAARGIASNVRFTGFICDVTSVIRAADAFVSLSTFEGMPNAVQEAMACGTPLVLSDMSAHRAVAADTARFANGCDAAEVARALVETLTDRAAACARAVAAKARAAMWTPDAIASAYDRLFAEVLAS
jgi:glycosyltransferase involved in cell wall biosynthesis